MHALAAARAAAAAALRAENKAAGELHKCSLTGSSSSHGLSLAASRLCSTAVLAPSLAPAIISASNGFVTSFHCLSEPSPDHSHIRAFIHSVPQLLTRHLFCLFLFHPFVYFFSEWENLPFAPVTNMMFCLCLNLHPLCEFSFH